MTRSESDAVRLFAFTCGWLSMPLGFFLDGEVREPIRVPVPAYLIEHPKGRAVFDTGLGVRSAANLSMIRGTSVEFDPTADIAQRLRGIGVDPDGVDWLINSHLHTDHCGGNASLPNATVVVQSKELQAARDGLAGYDAAEWDLGHRILALNGEHDLFGDGSVTLFPTPGHTAGHQCARVRLPKGEVILAADCCYMRQSLERMQLPRLAYDREEQLKSLRLIGDLRDAGAHVFFGHDPTFWANVPQAAPLLSGED